MATPTSRIESLRAACHCGAVNIEVPGLPQEINECQCTLCRRYGAAWAYYDPTNVKIEIADNSSTRKYIWGDRELEFHFCSTCGCVTHWKSIEGNREMGVNTRMMNPKQIENVKRTVDHQQLAAPLRSKETAHPDDDAKY